MTAVIKPSAYAKVILHAAKYPSCPIGGYVIGQGDEEKITISDVIPMCHSNPCGPMFEIAAEMVRIMPKTTLSCIISRLTLSLSCFATDGKASQQHHIENYWILLCE